MRMVEPTGARGRWAAFSTRRVASSFLHSAGDRESGGPRSPKSWGAALSLVSAGSSRGTQAADLGLGPGLPRHLPPAGPGSSPRPPQTHSTGSEPQERAAVAASKAGAAAAESRGQASGAPSAGMGQKGLAAPTRTRQEPGSARGSPSCGGLGERTGAGPGAGPAAGGAPELRAPRARAQTPRDPRARSALRIARRSGPRSTMAFQGRKSVPRTTVSPVRERGRDPAGRSRRLRAPGAAGRVTERRARDRAR